jgi:hypothetical protein
LADIFREVDEDLRRDRLSALWQRYGKYVIAFAVAVVLLTAANVGWQKWSESRRIEQSERYLAAMQPLEDGNEAAAANALAGFADDAGSGYATLARLQEAAARAKLGDTAGAVQVYDALADDDGIEPLYTELAVVLSAMHQLDTGDPQALRGRLTPIAAADSPWRHSAKELLGLLALRSGDMAGATEMFQQLADDPDAPQSARARAAELLASVQG